MSKGVFIAGTAFGLGTGVAQLIPTHRQCFIEIENTCDDYTLCNPSWFTFSGSCSVPLPPKIEPSKSGSALFKKTPHTARGSIGVFTYDLFNVVSNECREKIAVMFSNPYDFNLYSNWFAVGMFDKNKNCDSDLYHQMYNNGQKGFMRGKAKDQFLTYRGKAVTIEATMSDSYQPIIKVEVSSNLKF